MAKYFTIDEMVRSAEAAKRNIRNIPSHDVLRRLHALMDNCLDPIRALWGKPIGVNSGYRSPLLNRAVGGKPTSQHLRGEAADITTGSVEGNRKLFDLILASGIDYDQLIDESNYKWLHVSFSTIKNRKQTLHL